MRILCSRLEGSLKPVLVFGCRPKGCLFFLFRFFPWPRPVTSHKSRQQRHYHDARSWNTTVVQGCACQKRTTIACTPRRTLPRGSSAKLPFTPVPLAPPPPPEKQTFLSRCCSAYLSCLRARYNIPEQCRLDMTEHDIKTGKELLQVCYVLCVRVPSPQGSAVLRCLLPDGEALACSTSRFRGRFFRFSLFGTCCLRCMWSHGGGALAVSHIFEASDWKAPWRKSYL